MGGTRDTSPWIQMTALRVFLKRPRLSYGPCPCMWTVRSLCRWKRGSEDTVACDRACLATFLFSHHTGVWKLLSVNSTSLCSGVLTNERCKESPFSSEHSPMATLLACYFCEKGDLQAWEIFHNLFCEPCLTNWPEVCLATQTSFRRNEPASFHWEMFSADVVTHAFTQSLPCLFS